MRVETETVRSTGEHKFEQSCSMPFPENWDEAVEVYGEDAAWNIFISGLKVKLQNIAREAFRKGKSVEAVEAELQDYRGPQGSKKSIAERVFDLLDEKVELLRADPDTRQRVRDLVGSKKFGEAVEVLESLGEE